jgi:23S rRNA (cytosine1962-C5)-methyltransferase
MNRYALLDSGDGRRLEQVGPYRLVRQAACAWWRPRRARSEWEAADAHHVRDSTGGGHWVFHSQLPEEWTVEHGGVRLLVRPTPFGHLGLFAEHVEQWRWMQERIRSAGRPVRVLNLFAYTGGATIACAAAGAQVVHLDAAKGIVDWARRNAVANEVDGVSWVVEDAGAFVGREVKRGRRYDGILLDPPTFGRGRKGELWKVEEQLGRLLPSLADLLSPTPCFVVLTSHTPGFTGQALANLLDDAFVAAPTAHGEMLVVSDVGRPLPSGSYARRAFG